MLRGYGYGCAASRGRRRRPSNPDDAAAAGAATIDKQSVLGMGLYIPPVIPPAPTLLGANNGDYPKPLVPGHSSRHVDRI